MSSTLKNVIMESRTQELTKLLPYLIRDKLRYYLDYIHDRLIDIALEERVTDRLPEMRNQVDLIFLIRLLYSYFSVGYRNYEQMLSFFANKQVSGFQIGSASFTRQSPITLQWQQVADELENLVNEAGITSYVMPNIPIDSVLRQIIAALPDNTIENDTKQTE